MRVASIPAMPPSPALAPSPNPDLAPHSAFKAATALSDSGEAPAGAADELHIDAGHPSPTRDTDLESADGALSVATVSCL